MSLPYRMLQVPGAPATVTLLIVALPAGWRPGIYPTARRFSERLLQREVRALQADGVTTVVFTPGPGEQQVMGNDMMSRGRLDEVMQQSFLTAGAYAASPEVSGLIRLAAGPRGT